MFKHLKELHGGSTPEAEMYAIIAKDLYVDVIDVEWAVHWDENEEFEVKPKEYGLIIGRFQPFHYGHQHIINEVLLDGRTPLIVLGYDEGKNPKKNPLSVEERKTLIKLIYPNTEIVFVYVTDSNDDWDKWWFDIGHAVVGDSGRFRENITLYFNNKEQDRYDAFEVLGKEYVNEFYTQVFEDNGIKTKKVEFVERTDIVVDADATNIRDNFEAFKHLLDARIYWKLKEWGW